MKYWLKGLVDLVKDEIAVDGVNSVEGLVEVSVVAVAVVVVRLDLRRHETLFDKAIVFYENYRHSMTLEYLYCCY